ncbi:MAG: alpha-galactosidase [Acidobacteriota bacterium]
MNRRTFLCSTGATALGTLLPRFAAAADQAQSPASAQTLAWHTPELAFSWEISEQRLRQKSILPAGSSPEIAPAASIGVETAIQCTGENSPDPGLKQGVGQPGARLLFTGKREETNAQGRRLILSHSDPVLGIEVDSFYQAFPGVPVVRRWTRVTNRGTAPVGIDYISSAMLHGLADPQAFENELTIHLAYNSWMAEGQWHALRPSQCGFVENLRTSWSEASAGSVGGWSTEKYLPMAMAENRRSGLIWFWQIEHNGSWYWEISNVTDRGIHATDVYAWLGGPEDLHAAAWKNLQPGASYESVPVAVGCVRGGFTEAVDALTRYRRTACIRSHPVNSRCPVIFNDYMNCLWGNPTEGRELPLIDAAAKAGCEYFVIDAGWYADLHGDWSQTVGSWQPSQDRWPHGLQFVLDHIRAQGMIPGLWIEPEVAGPKSILAQKPDSWFMIRHGKRVLRNSRYLLDFRNPDVRSYLNQVIDRLVGSYKVGYLKMDYNVDSLQGTDLDADSLGQGLLEHNRALLAWLSAILDRYPSLVIENCGSGGGRMDYAMLSRLQLQSATDQENYLRLPAIITGASAAVVPEQLACWSYPLADADADQASFNMATAMMCRIHQSGRLDKIAPVPAAQVATGIRVYKDSIRRHLPAAVPFYPLGMPDVTDAQTPVALGLRAPDWSAVAVWRLEGSDTVEIPISATGATLVYPTDLGIEVQAAADKLTVRFPRPKMACIIQL